MKENLSKEDIGIKKEVEVKEIFNHWLPPLLGAEAVTVGNTIYYRKQKSASYPYQWLRNHEMVHVEQYKKYGVYGFLFMYLIYYLVGRLKGKDHWSAYKDIPFEIEARKAEKR